MWVDSKETLVLEMAEGQPVPFDLIAPGEIVKRNCQSFFETVLFFLEFEKNEFWKKMYELRWKFVGSSSISTPSCSVFATTPHCPLPLSPLPPFSPSPLFSSPPSFFSSFGSCSYLSSFPIQEEGIKRKAKRVACVFSQLLEAKKKGEIEEKIEVREEREREEGILFVMLCQYFENIMELLMSHDEIICFLELLSS